MNSSGITHYPVGLTAPPPKSIRAARLAGSQSRSVASSYLVRLRFSGVVVVVAGENGGWSRVARPDPARMGIAGSGSCKGPTTP